MEVCKSDMISRRLRNRMAALRGCVRRVAAAAQDREGKPGQATMFCPPQCLIGHERASLMPVGLSARSTTLRRQL
jgi:hypothetical protein